MPGKVTTVHPTHFLEQTLASPYKGSHAFKDPGLQVKPGLYPI